MNTPPKIAALVERFHDNKDAYKAVKYNEIQVQREFIDPLCEEPGWNVTNSKEAL
jgi:hypothetical protein